MMRLLLFLSIAFTVASCNIQKPLYSWDNYEETSYKYLKNMDEKSIDKLAETYQDIIQNQKGSRGVVPPGVFADYGFLLLQRGEKKKAREMFKQEIALYPESQVFIQRIIKMTEE